MGIVTWNTAAASTWAYHFLDLVPKGRDEDGLRFAMQWVRRHDQY